MQAELIHDALDKVEIVPFEDPRARVAELQLDADGFALPLSSRVAWNEHFGGEGSCLLLAKSEEGNARAGVAIELTPTRALPGHSVARVRAFGEPYATPAGVALLSGAVQFAKRVPRVLRLCVELQCGDGSAKDLLKHRLTELGFRSCPPQRIPELTMAVSLEPDEERLLNSFNASTRHKIRKSFRHGVEIEDIRDSSYFDRLDQLLDETFSRTGGRIDRIDWGAVVEVCVSVPHRSRLIGAFIGSGRDPSNLMAFAWGTHHGDRAVYDVSASTRESGTNLPLLYPIVWTLMTWAKGTGAKWFDLNGMTRESGDDVDRLESISRFKRGFGGKELSFGEEWIFEPNPMRARVAGLMSGIRRRIQGG